MSKKIGRWLAALLMVGCSGARAPVEVSPDEQFGHRYEGFMEGGRETATVSPPSDQYDYGYYPATVESVIIRQGPLEAEDPEASAPVEAVVLGVFSDGCLVLDGYTQQRTGHIIDATLTTRRPRGVMCTANVRPYRYYVSLPGQYKAGHYTFKLNEQAVTFEVRPNGISGR